MIDKLSNATLPRILSLATMFVLLAACGSRQGQDYCADHYLFHAAHLDSIAMLEIRHSNDGAVKASLSIPRSAFSGMNDRSGQSMEQLEEILREPGNVFSLQSDVSCNLASSNVTFDATVIDASYVADCGAGAGIEQIDVPLFDLVEQLDEVEAFVVTPATQKRFAISRRCESAIFRLPTRRDR